MIGRVRQTRPVVVAFQHFPPYPGGGAIRASYFATALAKQYANSADIVVLTTIIDPKVIESASGYRIESIGSDPVDNRRGLLSRALGELRLGLIAGIRATRLRPQLLVISSPGYIFAVVLTAIARVMRIPYVADIRDLYPEVYAEAGLIQRGSWVYRRLEALSKRIYAGARLVTAATDGLAKHISTQVPAANVHVVYNGYPRALLKQRTKKFERFTCSFHGVLGFYQDAPSLLALARALEPHDIDMVVIGYGRGEEIFAKNPPTNLTVTGRLPFAETMDMVAKAHVGLCLRTDDPISRDALPVKMFEYVALGLPSMVTPPSEAGRFVEHHRCGNVFEAGDIESMTAEMLRLRDDPAYRAAIVGACADIGPEFTREFQAARFADLVKAIDPAGRTLAPVEPD